MPRTIGLTGKTGAGKSTVASLLHEKGAAVIDGDLIARAVLCTHPDLPEALADAFGRDILTPNGVDRKLLARRAFADEASTALLNSLMHPVINREIAERTKEALRSGAKAVVVDAAAIIESGFAAQCDLLVVVTAPPQVRLERILARDGIGHEDAKRRMTAQKPDSFYTDKADYVIRNYPPYSPETELEPILKEIFDD